MSPDEQPTKYSASEYSWMAAVFLLGLGLRCFGASFGLPYLSNFYVRPDESLIVAPAARFIETSGNPGFFGYPALMVTLCAVLFNGFHWACAAWGIAARPDLVSDFAANPSVYFLLGRLLSGSFGALTSLAVYAMSRRMSGKGAAAGASLLYATAPLAVRDGHFATTDSMLTFFLATSVLMLQRYFRSPDTSRMSRLLAASVLVGLAASSKYTAFALAPLACGIVLCKDRGMDQKTTVRDLLVLAGTTSMVFVLLNPYAFLNWPDTAGQLLPVLSALFGDRPPSGRALPGLRDILAPFRHGPGGGVGLLLSLAGMTACLRKERSSDLGRITACGFILLVLPLAAAHVLPYRYALPAFPFIAVMASHFIFRTLEARALPERLVMVLLIAVMAGGGLWSSLQMDFLLRREDTRSLAGTWIEHNVPTSVPIVLLDGAECEPQVFESPDSIRRRIAYVSRLYGEKSGKIISELYLVQLGDHARSSRPGREVFRNPQADDVEGAEMCIVAPSYGPANPSCRKTFVLSDVLAIYPGEVSGGMSFKGISTESGDFVTDAVDAFFLPFNHLDEVARPGPNLDIVLLRRSAAPSKK